jgi:hypothetical protein
MSVIEESGYESACSEEEWAQKRSKEAAQRKMLREVGNPSAEKPVGHPDFLPPTIQDMHGQIPFCLPRRSPLQNPLPSTRASVIGSTFDLDAE